MNPGTPDLCSAILRGHRGDFCACPESPPPFSYSGAILDSLKFLFFYHLFHLNII